MFKSFYFFIFFLVISGTGCELKDPEIPNEEELITSLKYILTPVNGGPDRTLSFQDLDGDGGSAPVIHADKLSTNTSYFGSLEISNEQESPSVNISQEIEAEGDAHQFFFQTFGDLSVVVQYDDKDNQSNPIGLKNRLITHAASSGKLTITLRHEPDKTAAGVAQGHITNAGGETDLEITFDVEVE